jgi:hypothetical protein
MGILMRLAAALFGVLNDYREQREGIGQLCQNCVKTPSFGSIRASVERKTDAPSCWVY